MSLGRYVSSEHATFRGRVNCPVVRRVSDYAEYQKSPDRRKLDSNRRQVGSFFEALAHIYRSSAICPRTHQRDKIHSARPSLYRLVDSDSRNPTFLQYSAKQDSVSNSAEARGVSIGS
jgi:hypothetical protein